MGLPRELVVAERVAMGADVVTFSGDKLLGGPQAGIIVGRKEFITRIKKNPLQTGIASRKADACGTECDVTLVSSCARFDGCVTDTPLAHAFARRNGHDSSTDCSAACKQRLGDGFVITVEDTKAQIGSGTLPEEDIPSRAIVIRHPQLSAEKIATRFRTSDPPILGRIHDGAFLLDLRGIFTAEELVPKP